jgi:hypothetical protein
LVRETLSFEEFPFVFEDLGEIDLMKALISVIDEELF